MPQINYKEKVIELINEIRQMSEDKQSFDYHKTAGLLQKILYYAEQYFIDKSIKYQRLPHKVQEIEQEKLQVLARIRIYVEALEKLSNRNKDMIEFLSSWKEKLEYEDSLRHKEDKGL